MTPDSSSARVRTQEAARSIRRNTLAIEGRWLDRNPLCQRCRVSSAGRRARRDPVGDAATGQTMHVRVRCEKCGRPVEEHDRHVRFRLPDPVLTLPDREATPGAWLSEPDPARAVMMQVPGLGAFVRCLLPVHLTGGYTLTLGVWLGVDPADLRRAYEIWWEPGYKDLALDGHLANRLPIWDLLAARAHAEVTNPEATPYITATSDPKLARVLSDDWPHEDLLAAVSSGA